VLPLQITLTPWVNDEFYLGMWTYFDHLGPRTTNVAEGWHKGLNSQFGMPYPSLQSFLNCLQKCQCRLIQLASGRPTISNVRFATCDWTSKPKTENALTDGFMKQRPSFLFRVDVRKNVADRGTVMYLTVPRTLQYHDRPHFCVRLPETGSLASVS